MVKFLKFVLVGGSGTALNLSLFFLLVDRGGMDPTAGAAICFALAVTSNYLLNQIWTFQTQIEGEKPSVGRYARFVAVSLVGLGVNVGILNLVLVTYHPAYKVFGQAAGIACGGMISYIGSNLFTFRRKRQRR